MTVIPGPETPLFIGSLFLLPLHSFCGQPERHELGVTPAFPAQRGRPGGEVKGQQNKSARVSAGQSSDPLGPTRPKEGGSEV